MRPICCCRLVRPFLGAALGVLAAGLAPAVFGGPATPGDRIVVDQLGYLPDAMKTALVRRPIIGWDAAVGTSPPPGAALEIRRVSDGVVVMTAPLVAWNGGATHGPSGDRVWRADFSALETPGRYRASDPVTGDIGPAFVIDPAPYHAIARHAQRMYYYQRCGTPKLAEHAGAGFADDASHTGDAALRWIVDPIGSESRDCSGGWYDAGDYNKYVNFADDVIHELLDAYTAAPDLWTDDTQIPESGNGRADLLDEIAWELAWMRRMQLADGSVLHKVSSASYSGVSPPSADTTVRYYARATGTATMSVAGAFAHAAAVFGGQPDSASQALAADLRLRAELAWDWVEANPAAWTEVYDNDGGLFSTADAEDDGYARSVNRIRAAVYLFALTGDASYRDVVDAEYQTVHAFSWFTAIPYEFVWHAALLAYADLPGATASVAQAIRDMMVFAVEREDAIGRFENDEDAYRAWLGEGDLVWGSNRIRSHQGATLALALHHDLITEQGRRRVYRDAVAGYLHALHGVNPQGLVFLTALESLGVERSAREVYHAWFADGTVWDNADTSPIGPAPGYLTGGPNRTYAPGQAGIVLEPPMNQPPLKAYLDWNADWPESSWQITECHIPYQSAYIRLLAAVVAEGPAPCVAERDGVAGVSIGDLLAFLTAWFADDADLNADGATDVLDLLQYVAAFFEGCGEV